MQEEFVADHHLDLVGTVAAAPDAAMKAVLLGGVRAIALHPAVAAAAEDSDDNSGRVAADGGRIAVAAVAADVCSAARILLGSGNYFHRDCFVRHVASFHVPASIPVSVALAASQVRSQHLLACRLLAAQ